MVTLDQEILKSTGTESIINSELVQTLWSGYGEIRRYFLEGGKTQSVIVKHIKWPNDRKHPKGWNSDLSHQRKLTSYEVELNWYKSYTQHTNKTCRTPQTFQAFKSGEDVLLIIEDLNVAGFDIRLTPENVSLREAKSCLKWLAHFHAKFINRAPDGLWDTGTYWHLQTRPDELERMRNLPLKNAAKDIDRKLIDAQFQTLVHGDAKLANFCFSKSGSVAAVDFQYVGKGCGMKDVAYLISSCFEEKDAEKYEEELFIYYFSQLEIAVDKVVDFQLLKKEWSSMYKYAWADFYRFLDGWSPGHWKMNRYSKRLTQQVLDEL